MFHRLSDSKTSEGSKGVTSPSVRRINSDKASRSSVQATSSQPVSQIHNVAIPRQPRDGPAASTPTATGHSRSPAVASPQPSIASAPTRVTSHDFVQLSQSPRAASFRSAGSNGTQQSASRAAQAVPILSAEETVERSTTKNSRHSHQSPSKTESPSKKKKKDAKRERRDSAKVAAPEGSDAEDGESRAGSAYRKKGSMRRRGSVRSEQGPKGEGSAGDGASTATTNGKDDLLSDGDEAPRPLSRHTSTLSTRQQNALARTPSFLSRKHTPPPKLMREMTMRRRRQVHATTAGSAPTDDDDDITAFSAGHSASLRAAEPSSTIVDVFHLPDVESLESSRQLLTTTPSLSSGRPGATTHSVASTPSPGMPATMGMTPLPSKLLEQDGRKAPPAGRALRTPSLNTNPTVSTSTKSSRTQSISLTPTPTEASSPSKANGAASPVGKSLLPVAPVPAPPARKTPLATPIQAAASLMTVAAPSSVNASLEKQLSTQQTRRDTAGTSSNSASHGFDRYIFVDGDSVNNSLVMHGNGKASTTVVAAEPTVQAVAPGTSGTHARKTSVNAAQGSTVSATVGGTTIAVKSTAPAPLATTATVASPTRTATRTSSIPMVLIAPSSQPVVASPTHVAVTTPGPASSAVAAKKPALTLAEASPTPSFSVNSISVDGSFGGAHSSSPSRGPTAPTAPPTPANLTQPTKGAAATTSVTAVKAAPSPLAFAAAHAAKNNGDLQPAKRGAQNPIGLRTTTTASTTTTTTSATAATATPNRPTRQVAGSASKLLSPTSSDDMESSQLSSTSATPPIMIPRRARQIHTIVDDDEDVFTSSSAAPEKAMTLATPTAAASTSAHKRSGVAALQAIGVNISVDDDDDDDFRGAGDEDEEDEEEGLLDGFRPEGYDAKRGHRRSSAITLFVSTEDIETSSDSDDGDGDTRRGPGASRSGFSDYNVSMSNVQLSAAAPSVAASASANGVPRPRVQVSEYVAPRESQFHAKPPTLPVSGNPYATTDGHAGTGPQSRSSRRPTRTTTRPTSRASRNSLSALDQYGFGLDSSATSLCSAPGATWKLPKANPGILASHSSKYKPDPNKVHRPIANTFGRRRGRPDDEDEEDDDDDEEYEYDDDEEWYWEEVEEDEEEEDEESELSTPVMVKAPH